MHHSFLFGAASLPVPGPIWKLALYILWSFILFDLLHQHHQFFFPLLLLCFSLSPDTFSVNRPPFYLSAALDLESLIFDFCLTFPCARLHATAALPALIGSQLEDFQSSVCLGFHTSVRPPRELFNTTG
ncbi:hypothetical protein P168DRAFT_142975 [Aspergillus campestris IBT 28561]|uniref:Uncharacterized protein n=1 Tax=Aspergillus campestris (strain IBT 28561) TaxID=1392248 RepID=A0A2I1D551_ASPC2|nr:uncharacterized protein P168DRAFT_142975 [Aspergillus campestris IBT 28561]PKY04994.1 hypothetical protein P168DRAFT_142975 [Aspergillus campestris IBT 28561]